MPTPEPQPRPEADDPPRVNATLAALRRQQQAVAQRVVVKQRPGAHPALPAVRRQQLPRRLLQPLAIPRTALRALGLRRPALRLRHHDLLGVGPARRGPVPPPPHPRTGANLGRPGPAAGRRDRKLARQALEEARRRNSAAAALAIRRLRKRVDLGLRPVGAPALIRSCLCTTWWSGGLRGLTDDFCAPCWSVRRIPTHGRLTPCGN